MKPFRFRLERILRVREVEERVARVQLAGADYEARSQESLADVQRSRLEAARADVVSSPAATPAERMAWDLALDAGLAQALAARERARTARLQAEALRPNWTEKRSAAQGLERLRSRLAQEYALEERREESIDMDEIASRRFADRALRERRTGDANA